jgi:phospholipid transport system substrate-binding protein
MIMNKLKSGVVALALLTSIAFAVSSPLTMLQTVCNQMLAQLAQNKTKLQSSPALIPNMVNQVLIPHVDVNRMAGTVVGREVWLKATPQQKSQFIAAFTKLVVSTYSSALASYDDDQVKFYPLRGGVAGAKSVQVNSVIIRKTGQTIAVSYNLEKIGDGWKIYDFVIENVSMLQSYQSQFASTLAQGGMPALLAKLQARNN